MLDTINQGLRTEPDQCFATQQTALTAQLAAYSARLTAEYNAMDTAVAALEGNSDLFERRVQSDCQRGVRHLADQHQLGQRQSRHRRQPCTRNEERPNTAPCAATAWSPKPVPRGWCRSCSNRSCRNLATAQGCMGRIENNLPLNDVIAKGKALGKAIRLINQLNNTLDMERGRKIARKSARLVCIHAGATDAGQCHQ